MNHQEIGTIVTEILMEKLGVSDTKISAESTMQDLGADSLDVVEIILEIEHKFGISIPDNIIPEVQNIGSLCKYIEKELGKTGEQLSKMEAAI